MLQHRGNASTEMEEADGLGFSGGVKQGKPVTALPVRQLPITTMDSGVK
ncbi:MAG: hypothetical protein JRI76_08330 [Deltaproteobacteria bacterium]|nr:hypothetical protein [Deltaproteobacteria bacterium]MBW1955399.1 hypothetical protein [Deltaproteobacteria bacterium]MBW2042025.1 hypothetical protein [Deltaproteobacteria bacterium]MBW2133266.1 hypothetical protein [Deltaproteobacteria bacterium]